MRRHAPGCHCNRCIGAPDGLPSEEPIYASDFGIPSEQPVEPPVRLMPLSEVERPVALLIAATHGAWHGREDSAKVDEVLGRIVWYALREMDRATLLQALDESAPAVPERVVVSVVCRELRDEIPGRFDSFAFALAPGESFENGRHIIRRES